MRLNADGRTVAAMDVLAPGIGEIIGGSQREERLEVLDASMAERGIDQEHYAGYRDLRATAPCRMPASASASSAPSPTSPALPTCATRSPSPAPRQRAVLDAHCLGARVSTDRRGRVSLRENRGYQPTDR
jgi:hypothetical protein